MLITDITAPGKIKEADVAPRFSRDFWGNKCELCEQLDS